MARKHLVRCEHVNLSFYFLMDNGLLTKLFSVKRAAYRPNSVSFCVFFGAFKDGEGKIGPFCPLG